MRKKSALKANRVSIKKRLANKKIKENYKKALKKAKKSQKTADVKKALSLLDRAGSKKTIHKNKAARLKSRLAKAVGKKESAPKSAPKKQKRTKKAKKA